MQIGIARTEPTRSCNHLIKGCVDAAGFRMDECRQGIDIRIFQFGKLPIFDDLCWQRMLLGELLQNIDVRTGSTFFFLDDRESEFIEKDGCQLFGRGDIELMAGEFMNLNFQSLELFAILAA